jgi:hypothetical protein
LLLAHRVDLVLAGHYHSYMRTTRIANDSAVHHQPVHHAHTSRGGSGADNTNATNASNRSPPYGIYHFTIGSAGGQLDTAGMVPGQKDWQLHFEETFG